MGTLLPVSIVPQWELHTRCSLQKGNPIAVICKCRFLTPLLFSPHSQHLSIFNGQLQNVYENTKTGQKMFYLVRVTALVIWCTNKNLCSSNWLFTTQKNKITFIGWPPQGQNQEGGFQVHSPVLPALDSSAHRKFSQKQLQLDWQEDCSQADINRVNQMQKETKGTKTRRWKTCKIRQCIYELAEKTPQQHFDSTHCVSSKQTLCLSLTRPSPSSKLEQQHMYFTILHCSSMVVQNNKGRIHNWMH